MHFYFLLVTFLIHGNTQSIAARPGCQFTSVGKLSSGKPESFMIMTGGDSAAKEFGGGQTVFKCDRDDDTGKAFQCVDKDNAAVTKGDAIITEIGSPGDPTEIKLVPKPPHKLFGCQKKTD